MGAVERCLNWKDFRELARRRLPAPLFHYIDGAADEEWTLHRNTAAFDEVSLIPNGLADLSTVDMSTTVLGRRIEMPLMLSPTAMTRLFHNEGERAVAAAADSVGTYYGLSTLSTVSIEEIGALTASPKMFQIYVHKDRDLTYGFIERCRAAGFSALCLTIDTLIAGNRERDLRTGMVIPPRLTLASLASFAWHWRWAFDYLTHEPFKLANIEGMVELDANDLVSVMDYVNAQFDPAITWADVRQYVDAWGGPFAIKGVMSVDDARRARDIGATAIMISNHGGRQLDGAPAPFDVLPAIVAAVGGEVEIILDGGIRRGTHVLKALAMGANACSMGRGYLYGLSAGGRVGVERAVRLLREEIHRDLYLMGARSLAELDPSRLLRHGAEWPATGADRQRAAQQRAAQ